MELKDISHSKSIELPLWVSPKQFKKIQRGFSGADMNDKWEIVSFENTIGFYRSWTGFCIYKITFEKADDRYLAKGFKVERDIERYQGIDDREDLRGILSLLIGLLLKIEVDLSNDLPKNYQSIIEKDASMNIDDLFKIYENHFGWNDKNFEASKFTNKYNQLEYGFFPLGTGLLIDNNRLNRKLNYCKTLIIGNDFGTLSYYRNNCKNRREGNSKTIKNLENIKIDLNQSLFSNLFMGLRDDEKHPTLTMTGTIKKTKEFTKLCTDFFHTQLSFLEPDVVILMGSDVGKTFAKLYPDDFAAFNNSFEELYNDVNNPYIVYTDNQNFGKRKFVLIPHASYAHINWNNKYKKIIEAISS